MVKKYTKTSQIGAGKNEAAGGLVKKAAA